jgi:arylsulfatase A-like enzyme
VSRPNVLLIMTDEERYPPGYESPAVEAFRRQQLPGRRHLKERGFELHRHYAASTACTPSRTSLFTGQYPSLHGVTSTDGMAKHAFDPERFVLDPDSVPTAGHWLRAAGYRTFYKGKWHLSYPDLRAPGSLEGLASSDAQGRVLPEVVELYRRTERLDPYGWSGWVGREPHGASPADLGYRRDPIFAAQVCELFDALEADTSSEPWFVVASLVNPHDIFASGLPWRFFDLELPDDDVPEIDPAPSEGDAFEGRPAAHAAYRDVLPRMMLPQEHDGAYRRFYYWLHKLVDREIGRIVERLEASRFAGDTFVLFTSDHGDLLGSHGGLGQKWYCAYDEATHVPMIFSGPGIDAGGPGLGAATSHVDLLPTLLGLADVDIEATRVALEKTHTEVHELPGRDLSALLLGRACEADVDAPIYFMTEDQMSRGAHQTNRITGEAYDAVPEPANIESVIARLPTGPDGALELWKLNHYYERLAEWEREQGVPEPVDPLPVAKREAAPPARSEWELFNLTADPDERQSRADSDTATLSTLESLLERTRGANRRLPRHRSF